ncbi:MAG TPA: FtsX-like permease family protein [Actinomycetota bacterium]|nr:FtsX-like permease family protein [Actinomycetota bacterium]
MWRATLKGLLAHKVRLGLTALSIVLGVGFVSGTYLLTDTMNRAFDDLFRTINKGVAVQVEGVSKFEATGPGGENAGTAERVPNSLVAVIKKVPGVRTAEGTLTGYAEVVGKDGKAVTTGGAPTLGVSAIRDRQLSAATPRAGRQPERSGEIGIDAQTARKHHLGIGDRVTVLLQGPSMKATIVGIFGLGSADNLGGATLTVFDPQTAQKALNGGGKWDTINVAADAGVSPSGLRDRIQRALPKGFEAKTGEEAAQASSDDIKKALSFFNIALLVFAFVALFVGSFLIFNTFSILIAQRTRELALLRALGATARQVRRSVLTESGIVGAAASAVGLGFGFLIAIGLQGLLRAFGIELPSTSIQLLPRTVIAAFVVGIGTTLVASIMPAVRASRVPPVAAMRDTTPAEYTRSRRRTAAGLLVTALGIAALLLGLFAGRGAAMVGLGAAVVFLGVAVLSPLVARPFARVLGAPLRGVARKLGRENAMRNPRRTASTAAALMIGLGLVSFVAIFAASIKVSTARALEQTLRADYIVTSPQFTGFSQDVAGRLRTSGKFGAVEEFRMGLFGFQGRTQQLQGVDPAVLLLVANVPMQAGSVADLKLGDVLVYRQTAESNHWHVGSEIPAQFARTGKQTLRVIGIYTDNRLLGNYLVSLDTYRRNFTEQLDFVVLAKTAPGVSQATAKAAVSRVAKEFPNVKLEDQAQFRKSQSDQINQLLGLITALLFLAIGIAFVGIWNTLSLSIFERTHEIGLMRAVGMARRQIRTMIRWEAVIIAVFGAALGAAVGIFFGWAMVHALKSQGITALSVPGGQLITYIAIAGLLGVAAAAVPARSAARLDILRAIASE